MRRYFTSFLAVVFLVSSAPIFADSNTKAKDKALQNLKSLNSDEYHKFHRSKRPSEDKIQIYQELLPLINSKSQSPLLQSKDEFRMESLPESFRVPGEFEESQAVFISWPSYAYDEKGDIVEPFTPGVGLKYKDQGGYEVVEIEGYIMDLFEDSPFPKIWAELADAIQYECTAWIRVVNLPDTVLIKEYMQSLGKPLYNYEFISDPDGENAFWTRDFGPYGAYDKENDNLFFINAQYYPWRPIDNYYPELLVSDKGYKFYSSQLETEGGNIIADGKGTAFFGDVVYWNNADSLGPGLSKKERWNTEKTREEISKTFNLKHRYLLNSLNCDGGTGHLDIYLKLIDDETFIITKFPEKYYNVNFGDYPLINNNRNFINQQKSAHNSAFRFLELPLPTDDDGTQNRISCNTFAQDARGFINGLIVNKSFIFPVYSDDESGNAQQTQEVVELLKSYLPGYRIVPIDSRALSPLGGAIHCITMQIPANDPVDIKHKPVRGTVSNEGPYEIEAVVQNNSGIKSVKCHWRIQDSPIWFIKELTGMDSLYIGFLGAGVQPGLQIEYYLSAETNSGKIAKYPMTAPDGYFAFKYIDPAASVYDFSHFDISISPNPASDYVELRLSSDIAPTYNSVYVAIDVYNVLGVKVLSSLMPSQSMSHRIEIEDLPVGAYFIRIGNRTLNFVKF